MCCAPRPNRREPADRRLMYHWRMTTQRMHPAVAGPFCIAPNARPRGPLSIGFFDLEPPSFIGCVPEEWARWQSRPGHLLLNGHADLTLAQERSIALLCHGESPATGTG